MVARVAADDLVQRFRHWFQKSVGRTWGRHTAERVPVPPRVLHRQIAGFTLDSHLEHSVLALELGEPTWRVVSRRGSLAQLPQREIAQRAQNVAQGIRVLRGVAELLQEAFVFSDDLGIEQAAQLGLAQELAQTFV